MRTRSLRLALLALIALHVWAFVLVRDQLFAGFTNFPAFYGAGKVVESGAVRDLYQVETQRRAQAPVFAFVSRLGPLLYFHPPFEALLFWLLAHLSYGIAYCLWCLANLAILVALPPLVRPYVPALAGASRGALSLAFLAFFPACIALIQGQDVIPLALLFALSFISLKQGREARAGCLLAAGLFRYQFVLPIALLFAVRKRWKFLAGFSAVAAVLLAVSVALVGIKGLLDYPVFLWQVDHGFSSEAVRYTGQIHPSNIAALRGIVFMTLGGALPESYVRLVTLAVSAGLLGWWATRSASPGARSASAPARLSFPANQTLDMIFSMDVCVVFLVSYHAHLYDMPLLWLPIVLLLNHLVEAEMPVYMRSGLAAIAAIFFLTPAYIALGDERGYLLCLPVVLLALGIGAAMRQRARATIEPIAAEAA